jgi:hypothetical protein
MGLIVADARQPVYAWGNPTLYIATLNQSHTRKVSPRVSLFLPPGVRVNSGSAVAKTLHLPPSPQLVKGSRQLPESLHSP